MGRPEQGLCWLLVEGLNIGEWEKREKGLTKDQMAWHCLLNSSALFTSLYQEGFGLADSSGPLPALLSVKETSMGRNRTSACLPEIVAGESEAVA